MLVGATSSLASLFDFKAVSPVGSPADGLPCFGSPLSTAAVAGGVLVSSTILSVDKVGEVADACAGLSASSPVLVCPAAVTGVAAIQMSMASAGAFRCGWNGCMHSPSSVFSDDGLPMQFLSLLCI